MWKGLTVRVGGRLVAIVTVTLVIIGLTSSQPNPVANLLPTAAGPESDRIALYSAPAATSQTSGETSTYPTPVPARAMPAIPEGRIVAISSTGEVVDFSQEASRAWRKFGVSNGSRLGLAVEPQPRYSSVPSRIVGSDDRVEIPDTTVWPWTTVVKITGHLTAENIFICTGWMLGQSTVVTAGHCIYDFPHSKKFAYDVTATPAYNAAASNFAPFGSCRALRGIILSPWLNTGDVRYDYGVYELDCRIGIQTGHLGFKIISGSVVGTSVAVTGYPVDKGGTTMWTGLGTITAGATNSFSYNVDTAGWQSGAPVWDALDQSCQVCVLAINAYEFASPLPNQGPRIDETAFSFLVQAQRYVAPSRSALLGGGGPLGDATLCVTAKLFGLSESYPIQIPSDCSPFSPGTAPKAGGGSRFLPLKKVF